MKHKMTKAELMKKEKIAKAMKIKKTKEYMKKKYDKRADEVRSRTAIKMAQKDESYNPYKEKLYSLLENTIIRESFKQDVMDAINTHVKDPDQTISSSHGDDFSIRDHAFQAVKSIENSGGNHPKQIEWLKSYLPHTLVDELMKKHFG